MSSQGQAVSMWQMELFKFSVVCHYKQIKVQTLREKKDDAGELTHCILSYSSFMGSGFLSVSKTLARQIVN